MNDLWIWFCEIDYMCYQIAKNIIGYNLLLSLIFFHVYLFSLWMQTLFEDSKSRDSKNENVNINAHKP